MWALYSSFLTVVLIWYVRMQIFARSLILLYFSRVLSQDSSLHGASRNSILFPPASPHQDGRSVNEHNMHARLDMRQTVHRSAFASEYHITLVPGVSESYLNTLQTL
ncbi:hypothetical protein J6590_071308 [Homalodisca vitripennis]|nr:hypothetical protein J6590_071308 [Homalodisca vitripennis]